MHRAPRKEEPMRCFICIDVFLRRVSAAAEERKYFLHRVFPVSAGYLPAILFVLFAHTPAFFRQHSLQLFLVMLWCMVRVRAHKAPFAMTLSAHTTNASHDCHVLRYHTRAHDAGVSMPPLSPASRTAWWYCVGAAALFSFFRVVRPRQPLFVEVIAL